MSHGEVVALHFGQAGIQAGHAFWTQLCAEHRIASDGTSFYNPCEDPDAYPETMFTHTSKNTYSPRAFCIDTDPGSLDWVQLGDSHDLYNPGQIINGKEDAGGCFARGYHHYDQNLTANARHKIRRVLENCDKFQGFLVFRSLSGGTGSGLTSNVMKRLSEDYHNTVIDFDILPSFKGGLTLDPYNVVLSLHQAMDFVDVSFLFSNQSMCRIANTSSQMGVKRPNFQHVNQIIANVASHITNGLRFKSDLSMSLVELQTNLVPLPRMKYPVLAYSPFCPPGRSTLDLPLSTLINNLFTKDAQLVPCDMSNNRYVSAVILLRGQFQPDDVNQYIHRLTNHPNSPIKFVDWLPPSVKYSLCTRRPAKPFGTDLGNVRRSAVACMNQTGMEPVLRPYINSFKKMFCNKAFLHLYKQEGMSEQDFLDAYEHMLALQDEFKRISEEENSGERKCVQITLPRDLVEHYNPRPCGPCRILNLNLSRSRSRSPTLRVCDKGCGPIPSQVWKCPRCVYGRDSMKTMNEDNRKMMLYGKNPKATQSRPPCETPEPIANENDKEKSTLTAIDGYGCTFAKMDTPC